MMERMSELDKATFAASFPPIQSAILRTGNGDGLRVKLDVPESEMAEGVKLFGMVGKRLKVTIEVWTELDDATKKGTEGGGDKMGRRRIRNRRNQ